MMKFKAFDLRVFVVGLALLWQSIKCRANVAQVESHVILQGCKETKPNEWWIRMKESLEERLDIDSVTCTASREDEWNAANALAMRKANNPDIEIHLVASILSAHHCEPGADCSGENLGEAFVPLLQTGVIAWFIEAEPNFEALGVNRTELNIQSTELFPDNGEGGRAVGQEFCRVAESIAPATIAVLYGDPTASHSTLRIESFKEGMNEYCPEAGHIIKYSLYAHWSAEKAASLLSPIFLRDGSINAVIAANDEMALGAIISVRQMRPDKKLLVAGYDANPYTVPLLASGKMFATVDQTPPNGIAYTLETLLSDKATGAGDFGEPTECSIQRGPTCGIEDYNVVEKAAWSDLIASLPNKVSTAVSIRVKDPSTLVLRERLLLYNAAVAPKQVNATKGIGNNSKKSENTLVPVLARLKNFQIYEIDAARQSTFGQGLLVLSWLDERLGWSSIDFPETPSIRIDINTIWHPIVIFSNNVNSANAVSIQTIQTTVFADGTVVWEQSIRASEYRCGSMDETLLHFPFDQHNCGLDLTSYTVGEVTLLPSTQVPPEQAFDVSITNSDWEQGESSVTLETLAGKFETLHFRVEMARDPTFVVSAMVVPSFLLNIISFAQFWIPAQSETINLDRGGMAITTILASLALRESTVSEVDTAFTLLDVFLLMSLCFHFIGFLITAYESSHQQIKRRTGLQLGSGDKLGKLVLPLIFGVFNLILSLIWAKDVWALFYLSLVQLLGSVLANRKARQHVHKTIRSSIKRVSIREKLGFLPRSANKDGDETANAAAAADPESVVRYMRWRAVANKELSMRNNAPADEEHHLSPHENLLTIGQGNITDVDSGNESPPDTNNANDWLLKATMAATIDRNTKQEQEQESAATKLQRFYRNQKRGSDVQHC